MRKRLIALVLCAVLVSAMSVTSVVSARKVSTDGGARQTGINYIIAALQQIWRGIQNPTQIPIGTPIAMLAIGIAMVVSNQI
jgi:glutamate mutase epsilon subunit